MKTRERWVVGSSPSDLNALFLLTSQGLYSRRASAPPHFQSFRELSAFFSCQLKSNIKTFSSIFKASFKCHSFKIPVVIDLITSALTQLFYNNCLNFHFTLVISHRLFLWPIVSYLMINTICEHYRIKIICLIIQASIYACQMFNKQNY